MSDGMHRGSIAQIKDAIGGRTNKRASKPARCRTAKEQIEKSPPRATAEEEWTAKSDTCASWIQAGDKQLIFHEAMCREHNAALSVLQRENEELLQRMAFYHSEEREIAELNQQLLNRESRWKETEEINKSLRERIVKAEAALRSIARPHINADKHEPGDADYCHACHKMHQAQHALDAFAASTRIPPSEPPPAQNVIIEQVISLTEETAKAFCSFGGGHGGEWNPIAHALKDAPAQFAAGVKIAEVVKFILERAADTDLVNWMEREKPTALCLCMFDGSSKLREKVVGHQWEINDETTALTLREAVSIYRSHHPEKD